MPDTTTPAPPRKRPRWGWRTLGFLALAIVAVVVSNMQGYHTAGTLGCLVIGLVGAGICSVKGWRALERLEWNPKK